MVAQLLNKEQVGLFDTVEQAAEKLGLEVKLIKSHLMNGKPKNVKGFTFLEGYIRSKTDSPITMADLPDNIFVVTTPAVFDSPPIETNEDEVDFLLTPLQRRLKRLKK